MDNELRLLAESNSYISPLRYISGRISEYDISSANITMLYKYGKINDKYYRYLSSLPKQNREVEIGLLIQSDHVYYDIIKEGIIDAKKKLFTLNNVHPSSIVRIANDAVYINSSTDLMITQFENVLFKQKSVWSSMLQLNRIIIFFRYINGEMDIDVKGLGNSKLLHVDYMLSMIANTIYILERVSTSDAVKFVTEFYEDYVNLRLDVRYYRELSPESLYHLKDSPYYITDISDIKSIDINYNLYIIRELWSIILDKFNSEIRRK